MRNLCCLFILILFTSIVSANEEFNSATEELEIIRQEFLDVQGDKEWKQELEQLLAEEQSVIDEAQKPVEQVAAGKKILEELDKNNGKHVAGSHYIPEEEFAADKTPEQHAKEREELATLLEDEFKDLLDDEEKKTAVNEILEDNIKSKNAAIEKKPIKKIKRARPEQNFRKVSPVEVQIENKPLE